MMTTFALKSELDAAQALLDLQKDYVDRQSIDGIEGPTTIARIFGTIISSRMAELPRSSTPKKNIFLSKWNDTSEKNKIKFAQREKKISSNVGTQTEPVACVQQTDLDIRDQRIKQLYAENQNLKAELKKLQESFNDSSSESFDDDYMDPPYSYKRKRNATTSSDFASFGSFGDYDSSMIRETKSPKINKRVLKPKNSIKSSNSMVVIGDGKTEVPSRLLKHMDWSSYTNATRKLLTAVFSRKVLATHSLTGKPSPAFPNKPAKKKLDPALVNDIVQIVVEKCGVPESVVRTSITTKCADESKMYKTREQNKKKRSSVKKENKSPDDSDESYLSD